MGEGGDGAVGLRSRSWKRVKRRAPPVTLEPEKKEKKSDASSR